MRKMVPRLPAEIVLSSKIGPEQARGVQATQLHRMLHGDGAQTGRLGLGEQAGGVSVEARGRRRVARIGHGHAEQQPVDGVGQRAWR